MDKKLKWAAHFTPLELSNFFFFGKFEIYHHLLDTEISVIPQPILQHHPTKHRIIVAKWLSPIKQFITKEQNFVSPSHTSSYLVRPQQQQSTNNPLIIVPEKKKNDFTKHSRKSNLREKISSLSN